VNQIKSNQSANQVNLPM